MCNRGPSEFDHDGQPSITEYNARVSKGRWKKTLSLDHRSGEQLATFDRDRNPI
jgi:hypothetical protein